MIRVPQLAAQQNRVYVIVISLDTKIETCSSRIFHFRLTWVGAGCHLLTQLKRLRHFNKPPVTIHPLYVITRLATSTVPEHLLVEKLYLQLPVTHRWLWITARLELNCCPGLSPRRPFWRQPIRRRLRRYCRSDHFPVVNEPSVVSLLMDSYGPRSGDETSGTVVGGSKSGKWALQCLCYWRSSWSVLASSGRWV